MGKIVSVVAMSHAPGLTGWLDQAPEDEQDRLVEGFSELGRLFRASKPDLIIGIANDHVLNLPMDNMPNFCVGTRDVWHGPAEWFKDWLNVPDYTVKGDRDLALALVRSMKDAGIRMAFTEDLLFDDNWSVPMHYLTPDHDVPLIPIHMNCVMPPLPEVDLCYRTGKALADFVENQVPDEKRVAILATGGLSHDPGGAKYFEVDEEFDRWFLDIIGAGKPDAVLEEVTIEKMRAAGDGGTTELLAWIAALGAAGGNTAETIVYEPAVELRCGMGGILFDEPYDAR